jgi:hypothetical protein
VGGTAALTTAAVTNSPIGSYDIVITQGTLTTTNYTLSFTNGTLTVTPAPLSITANNDSKTYDGNPYPGNNGVVYSGFVNAEDPSVLTGALSYSGTAQGAIDAGTYSITPSGLTDTNYAITFVSGTLTVNTLTVAVTADTQAITYGAADPVLTYSFSPALVTGDSFTGGLTRAAGETVGSYAILQGTLGLSANYVLNYTGANLVIGAAPLSITANNDSKTYGQTKTYGAGSTSFTSVGLQYSETIGSVTITAVGGTDTNATIGSYTLTPSLATGGSFNPANYAITYAPGTLTVLPATLVVSADNQSRAYGATNPVFTATFTGFVNGESLTNSDLGGAAALTTAAVTNSPIGTYDIVIAQGTLTTTNYTLSFTNGTLTVNTLTVAVTADAQAITYGAADPALTYTFTPALVTGDSFSGALTRTAGENVGSYAILQGTLELSTNYVLNYTGANLVIGAAPLTITANNDSKTYDGNAYSGNNGVVYSSFVNGEDPTVLTGSLSYGGTAQGAIDAGTYSIIPSGLADPNYAITFVAGTLTVNQAATSVGLTSSLNPAGYQAAVAFAASLPADASGKVVFSTASGAFSTNTVSVGSATSQTLTNLPRGAILITAAYLGDVNYVGSTNTLTQVITNHPPVANAITFNRNGLNNWRIAVTDLLTNATDVDGDTLSLTGVSTTTNGIVPIVSGGWVQYANTNLVADQFTYTVADGYGGTSSSVVTLLPGSSASVTALVSKVSFGSGSASLTFAGLPGYTYSVERSTDLVNWTIVETTNAPAGGAFLFTDGAAPVAGAYYRLMCNGN